MLTYEEQFAAPLAVLDEGAALSVIEFAEREQELGERFLAAVVAVAEEAGVEFDVLDAMHRLGQDLLNDGQLRRAAALALVQAWFERAEAQEASAN
jgi:hypothetical protein